MTDWERDEERSTAILEEYEAELSDGLRGLLLSARRARPTLTPAAAEELLQRVLVETKGAGGARNREHLVRWVGWAAALIATVLLAAILRPSPPAAGPEENVVKEAFFESVHGGKVSRLEIVLRRVDRRK